MKVWANIWASRKAFECERKGVCGESQEAQLTEQGAGALE